MKYQPNTFKDCQIIHCKDCIITNTTICILTSNKSKLTKIESKILVDKRYWEIIKYKMNKIGVE